METMKDEMANQMQGVAFPMQQRNIFHAQSIELEAPERDFTMGEGDIRFIGGNGLTCT